ncbi:MAG: Gfo/Idh/MocA family oxidoreductase [Clostridiales bacterium]|mgnify:CR=1 FL=1|nr:Gfo/Idh/MocA family oxidoreductase [Clostridiales bacterium]
MTKKVKIGFVGVGNISSRYLNNITKTFREIEIIGVCDLVREKAEEAVEEYKISKLYNDMYELFSDPEVDIVLNITEAFNHYEVTKAALSAGKNVYSEKPLAHTFPLAKELYELAQSKGLYLGGAPDTFMGAGIQTARKLIDSGFIGEPFGASARMIQHGPEYWHPDSEPFYGFAGGPVLDMGPYYTTALINLLGRCKSVTTVATKPYKQRVKLAEPRYGSLIDVDVQTYCNSILEFDSGAVANTLMTFDVFHPNYATLEIYGTEGTLFVPDPNCFSGKLTLMRESKKTVDIDMLFPYTEESRGLGLADMAKAIKTGRAHRADSRQQLHVVEMLTFMASEEPGTYIMETPFERHLPMKQNAAPGILD